MVVIPICFILKLAVSLFLFIPKRYAPTIQILSQHYINPKESLPSSLLFTLSLSRMSLRMTTFRLIYLHFFLFFAPFSSFVAYTQEVVTAFQFLKACTFFVLLNVSFTYCSHKGKEGRLNQTEDRLPGGLPCL